MGFEPHLHWSFQNEHVLFPFIVLRSASSFVVACIVVMLICLSERFISFALDKQWSPNTFRLSRMRIAVWRTGLYSCVTFLRLCYMLVAMSFHMGLIFTIVATLSIAQFFVELRNLPKSSSSGRGLIHKASSQPLLSQTNQEYPPHSMKTRPRSRSKPDDIFIHPAESNIARADAVALELGLTGDTERVQGYTYNREEPAWEIGKGKDMAREMLLGAQKKAPHSRDPFYISNSDSDSD
ncbi:unnamed protein product [Cyclocybe aegerita]|uniref:Copper transporter n=1 Tax=Cyclocybe aegerita TaxID=1973307 RepID=A0A8S0WKS1_CYCAE|nr:unnamed protein product [Cyclocybe aegerita]